MSYENFLDTSAILNGGLTQYSDIVLCPLIFIELEQIKNNKNKSNNIKFAARQAISQLLQSTAKNISFVDNKIIKKYLSKYNFLLDINDHHIIIAADNYGKQNKKNINFITSDSSQFLFAQKMSHLNAIYFKNPINQELSYIGWTKCSPTATEMTSLYENMNINSLKCHTNEFVKIFENNDLKDLLFWNGNCYRHLNYKELKNKFLNLTIRPLNAEQKMAFDLLQNKDISVKLLVGSAGTGKILPL